MASNSKISDTIRIRKLRKHGRKRKKLLHREGSTASEKQLFGNVLPS